MFSYRSSFFETNSSSCHALVVPTNQEAHFSKIACSRGLDFLLENASGTSNLIKWLYDNGVEEIKYNGSNSYVRREITECRYNHSSYDFEVGLGGFGYGSSFLPKQLIMLIIFGPETYIDTRDDKHPVEDEDEYVFLGDRTSEY